ncbi:MAG: hypothetical protein Q607_CBUC00056G0017 [Clostridium butyricum DORA_1]|jgi:hypothetical protein|nr:MAG: hypothetical protein Q607_CBUC00056G0017 [Clostridium butyricum DORA_1]
MKYEITDKITKEDENIIFRKLSYNRETLLFY